MGGRVPSLAPKTSTHRVLVFLFVRGRGPRTRRRYLCRKQSHSAALLSLRVPTRRNVYQGCTHFVPVSFCAREQTSNNTIYYIKESAMNSENSSRFFSYAGSGGRTHTVAHRNLNPARLPIPPYPHTKPIQHITNTPLRQWSVLLPKRAGYATILFRFAVIHTPARGTLAL